MKYYRYKLKFLKFSEYREKCATLIQKRYRGMVGRGIVIDTRNIKMNKRVAMAKIVAKQELAAIIVQRTITAWLGRVEANKRITQRIKEKILSAVLATVIVIVGTGVIGTALYFMFKDI